MGRVEDKKGNNLTNKRVRLTGVDLGNQEVHTDHDGWFRFVIPHTRAIRMDWFAIEISDRYLKRAGLDYWPHVDLHYHPNLEAFWQVQQQQECIREISGAMRE